MQLLEEVNLAISGHTSSGCTSSALLLAYILQKRFIYAGGLYKLIASNLGYDPKTNDIEKYEKEYGEQWDVLWENYVSWKINNERNLLANTKISGFFTTPKLWLFEAFVTADPEVRASRAVYDNRSEDIVARDKLLQTRWKRLFKIDWLDTEAIRENYDILIRNDGLSIAETSYEIFRTMRTALGVRVLYTLSDFEKIEKLSHQQGKKFFYERLEKQNLLVKEKEICLDWINNFSEELSQTPLEWQEIVYRFATIEKS